MEMQRMINFQADKLAKVDSDWRNLDRSFTREIEAIAAKFDEPFAVLKEQVIKITGEINTIENQLLSVRERIQELIAIPREEKQAIFISVIRGDLEFTEINLKRK